MMEAGVIWGSFQSSDVLVPCDVWLSLENGSHYLRRGLETTAYAQAVALRCYSCCWSSLFEVVSVLLVARIFEKRGWNLSLGGVGLHAASAEYQRSV